MDSFTTKQRHLQVGSGRHGRQSSGNRRDCTQLTVWVISLAALMGVNGCGKSGVPRAAVEGTVTFEGAPIESGTIRFVPQTGVSGPPVELEVKDGKYRSASNTAATVGLNVVQVVATRKTGKTIKTIMGEEAEEVEQFIPSKYNEASELTVDVQSKRNEFNFDLTSK